MKATDVRLPAEYRHILVPVDFSPHCSVALQHAVALAGGDLRKVHVLHVVEPFHPSWKTESAELQQEYRAEARKHLDTFVRVHFPDGVLPPIECVGGFRVEEILGMAERLPADLIVIGTHGRKGLKRVVLGSVAERVIRDAPCPVLIVR